MHIRYVPCERSPFSALNCCSRLQSISFSQMTKNPLQSITVLHFLPVQRPSFSNFLYLQALHRCPRPAYCSQPESKCSGSAQGVTAGQSASQTRPTKSVPETRIFTLELAPEPRIFTLDSLQRPPFFTLPWHIPTQILGANDTLVI